MIDLPTQKEMESPHHRRALWALIAAGVIFAGLIAAYVVDPQPKEEQGDAVQQEVAFRQRLMNVPNPVEKTTSDQARQYRKLMDI